MRLFPALFLILANIAFGQGESKPPVIEPSAIEKSIHEGVNQERKRRSLPLLAWSDRLAEVARGHSRNMAKDDFFSHEDSDGDEVFERIQKHGYQQVRDFTMVAENIFKINTIRSERTYIWPSGERKEIIYNSPDSMVRQCIAGWMKSPGHRKNMLHRDLNQQGIGVALNDQGEVLITEVLIK